VSELASLDGVLDQLFCSATVPKNIQNIIQNELLDFMYDLYKRWRKFNEATDLSCMSQFVMLL
jgi:hypothetical protein